MKRIVLFGIFLTGSSLTTFSQSSGIQKPIIVTPTVSIQNFNWFENATVGKLGIHVQVQPLKKVSLSLDGGFFSSLGDVKVNDNYPANMSFGDKNQMGGSISLGPNGTTSFNAPKMGYQGGFVNIDAGIPIKLGDSSRTSIEPFVGIEAKVWNRSADYGTEGNPMVFEEKYKFLSPALGAKLNYATKSKVKVSLRISTSYPLISKMKTDEKNLALPNTEIDLTKMLSPSVELGVRVKKVTIKLRYERINIGTSDSIRGYTNPASKANVTGVSIGYDF
ncbi:hypothetical protein VB796_08335 [Arcicella sp. LKC2W]|uniref:hypothetical protein n=1 Tax=Arcicella sp. LKC2W TaxID=2984198 RepID=UPI002B1F8B35|nr:hypothetical protein [Arcicella sp. LKC2W]MEA5459041.1 hypothetical protein [Arcicella sp. LKC2W]